MSRVSSRGSDQFIVRFPEGMRDEIKRAAEHNGRSMNAEIIQRLSETIQPWDSGQMFLAPEFEKSPELDLTDPESIQQFVLSQQRRIAREINKHTEAIRKCTVHLEELREFNPLRPLDSHRGKKRSV